MIIHMITLILFIHIAVALMSFLLAGKVIWTTRNKRFNQSMRNTQYMWRSTVATIFSGILLAIVTKSSIGGTCMTLLAFLSVVLIAHYYQRSVINKINFSNQFK